MKNFYLISEKIDSTKFFKFMNLFFKDATSIFIEGTSISKDMLNVYKNNLQKGEYLPSSGTLFPKSQKFRCEYSPNFLKELEIQSEKHAEPELFDHFHLYKDGEPIIVWKDAFYDEMFISIEISKKLIDEFIDKIKTYES